ncbi:MAG: hypothetical protein WC863_01945 [Patescibacteria group bacterium]
MIILGLKYESINIFRSNLPAIIHPYNVRVIAVRPWWHFFLFTNGQTEAIFLKLNCLDKESVLLGITAALKKEGGIYAKTFLKCIKHVTISQGRETNLKIDWSEKDQCLQLE